MFVSGLLFFIYTGSILLLGSYFPILIRTYGHRIAQRLFITQHFGGFAG